MPEPIQYDQLLKINGDYFLASHIELIRVEPDTTDIAIYLSGGHIVNITEGTEKNTFREQYLAFCSKNGVKLWGEL